MNKILLCIGVVCVGVVLSSAPPTGDRILQTDVKMLKFKAGEYAVNTRTNEDIPRLSCAYNPLGDDSRLPTSVTCRNKGLDDRGNIIWKCEAEMDKSLEFDNLQVSCEGYDFPGDKYIRAGSCALTYTLKLAEEERHYHQPRNDNVPPPPPPPPQYDYNYAQHHEHYRKPEVRTVSAWTFSNVLILVLVCALIIRCCCRKSKRPVVVSTPTPMTENVNDGTPSAPPFEDEDKSMTKRTGYAENILSLVNLFLAFDCSIYN